MNVLAYGGGVDSTAMTIGLVNAGKPIDVVMFADTGGEKPATYAYVALFSRWLVARGYPAITLLRMTRKTGEVQTLEAECLERGNLPPIAYGYETCSQKYKIEPQDKYMRNLPEAKAVWAAGQKITKYVGYDAGEQHRVNAANDAEDTRYYRICPLIEWQWSRERCAEVILDAGLCLPPKSSCFFCPNMRKAEILSLPPELQARAIEMERNAAPNLTDIKGLGRSYKWGDLIHADKAQQKLFDDLDMYSLPCGCVD